MGEGKFKDLSKETGFKHEEKPSIRMTIALDVNMSSALSFTTFVTNAVAASYRVASTMRHPAVPVSYRVASKSESFSASRRSVSALCSVRSAIACCSLMSPCSSAESASSTAACSS